MCKQIDNSLVNSIHTDDLFNKSRYSHLNPFQLFKKLGQKLSSNNDINSSNDDSSESISSEVGSMLLEEFPCRKRSDYESAMTFKHENKSISRRRSMNNNGLTRNPMDMTMRDGLRHMSLD